MNYVWAAVLIVAVVALGIVAAAAIDAYVEFKGRPRVPMEFCSVHGVFRREYSLALPGTTARMCPRCFMEAMHKARKG